MINGNKILHELPIDVSERYKILKKRFIGEEDKCIRYLSELPSLRYLSDNPTFLNYKFLDNNLMSTSVSCSTFRLEGIKTSPFPQCFVLHSFQEMNGLTYVSGAYIDYDGEYYRRMREEKIDKIIE